MISCLQHFSTQITRSQTLNLYPTVFYFNIKYDVFWRFHSLNGFTENNDSGSNSTVIGDFTGNNTLRDITCFICMRPVLFDFYNIHLRNMFVFIIKTKSTKQWTLRTAKLDNVLSFLGLSYFLGEGGGEEDGRGGLHATQAKECSLRSQSEYKSPVVLI